MFDYERGLLRLSPSCSLQGEFVSGEMERGKFVVRANAEIAIPLSVPGGWLSHGEIFESNGNVLRQATRNVSDSSGELSVTAAAFQYFNRLQPVDQIGHAFRVFHVTPAKADELRRKLLQEELPVKPAPG